MTAGRGYVQQLRERATTACVRFFDSLLSPSDLLRQAVYRRLWTSIFISSLGGQLTMLALPLTAAVLLHASPTQMGLLTATEILPFVLFSLPAGVVLDRMRKLPIYVGGELLLAASVASVPLAWWLGWLAMPWLYAVGFVIGTINTTSGSAAQIVLTQVVPRERLVEAHAKNALASSTAEVAGPGFAGALIKLLSAPVALLLDAILLVASASILRGIRVVESVRTEPSQNFLQELGAGLRFVAANPLLLSLAAAVGVWQMCHNAAVVVQILFATRTLGLSEQTVGLAYIGLGVGTISASVWGHRISRRLGPGPCLTLGFGVCGAGWLALSLAPVNGWGVVLFAAMLFCFGVGAVLTFINFLSIRQAVTPTPLLGRMTSTMRWLILLPAGPGALLGGWLGEHWGLRSALAFAGVTALTLCALTASIGRIRRVHELPRIPDAPSAGAQQPAALGEN